ncbi:MULTISPECIES: efflux RND transporter periplasmic adaptor subunit [Rhizobium]|uniref:Efflux RND transporter periplasmic adaptor subunit n=1 Tax=Rhizobium rhododendri TaxID=2506430 RepID=A0ABY8IT41_9HYPH|nr:MULTISPECIES: efflux RND transporter periplasmic adaptor subunit [Rhizobium]TQX84245.1 efflux RND transporter periplasmic adaptor subunit [Rhizobium sp. rho-13.1]TQY07804.1 efflux RND transporter periplasmic adaptor subunit [Rhizobium sp. rho-1.1]WFS26332.1 efflux RND transporter periplasmic adaptor subunit [Rhizobium rhododendri]
MNHDAIPTKPAVDTNPRRPRDRAILGSLAFLLVAGTAVSVFWPAQKSVSAQSPKAAAAAIPVDTASVTTQDLPIERSGLGVVTPLTAVDVKVRIDGQLQKVLFSEGQTVHAGDAIAQIDPRPYDAALAQAQASLQKDMAQLASNKLDEARARRLTTSGGGTTQAADLATAQVAVLQATVDGDQAAVDIAKLNLSFATVTAPISGRAGLRTAEQGAIVHSSDTAGIVTITQMHPIVVEFTLPQDEVPALVDGQSEGVLAVSVDSRDGSKHLGDGRLSVIDSQVDTTTGMIKLKAEFANGNLALWPGELVTARIVLRTEKNQTVVPSAAIQNGQTGPYVFVMKPDQTVATSSVKTGPVVDGMTSLLSGAAPGDKVVISGQSRLTDGTKIAPKLAVPQKVASAGEIAQ